MELESFYNPNKELEFQIQLGGELCPEYPVKSISESFSILKQTLNLPDWGAHSVGIDCKQYQVVNLFLPCLLKRCQKLVGVGPTRKQFKSY